MTTQRLLLPLACLVAFAAPALANQLEGTYRLTGTHEAAPNATFQSEITVRKVAGGYAVTRKVTLGDGSTSTRSGEVDASLVGSDGFQLALTGTGGMTTLIAPGAAVPSGTVMMDFRVDANGRCTSRTRDALGEALATGERRIEELGGAANGLLIYTKGGLKTILGKGIEKLFESGVGVSQTLKLGDALHVGLELETELLEDGELLPLQREVLQAEAERHVWLQTSVEGGIRFPFHATIPVGGAGNVSVGFTPGAKLRYEVTDLYKVPSGITDGKQIVAVIKEASRHVYEATLEGRRIREGRIVELPLTAAEASALQIGAERHVEGEWTVALNGSIGVGETTKDVSPLEIGATARVGGFYRIRDWLRVELTRLPGDWVRVHLMDGRLEGPGAEARAFVGATINTDEETGGWSPSAEYLEPVVDVVNDQVVKKLLKFEIKAQKGKDEKRELDLSYRFDLTKQPAAMAYERAVKGDFTLAASLFQDPANGVVREFRVVELEERFYEGAELELSVVIDGKVREDVEIAEIFVQDPAGNHFHRVFRFQDERKLSAGAIWENKWSERIYVSVIRSDDVDHPQVTQNPDGSFNIPVYLAERSFRFRYDLRDAHLRKGEAEKLKRVLTALGIGDADGIPVPEQRLFRSRYGKAQARLEVDVAEWGIRTIMGKVIGEPDTVRQAFLNSYETIHGPADNAVKRFLRNRKADAFLEGMNALARNDVPDRAKVLNELCQDAGWDMTMIATVVSLAPRRTVRVQAALDGKRISFAAENAGASSELQIPNLYGH